MQHSATLRPAPDERKRFISPSLGHTSARYLHFHPIRRTRRPDPGLYSPGPLHAYQTATPPRPSEARLARVTATSDTLFPLLAPPSTGATGVSPMPERP